MHGTHCEERDLTAPARAGLSFVRLKGDYARPATLLNRQSERSSSSTQLVLVSDVEAAEVDLETVAGASGHRIIRARPSQLRSHERSLGE